MAVQSPQDIYARHLVSGRGYPLWTPEPSMSLPDVYRRQGLKIGDVGVVVPEDGSFDVFFNVCLPPTHSLHQETGVPNNFTPILLNRRDITIFPEAESAGRVISTSSVARMRNTDMSDEDPERRAQPGPLNYEFTLSSRGGAVLILPEGAERYYLRNERLFLDAAIQHAVDWYTFAEQRLGRIISHDSLYLITGFYKAHSWSLAAYQQGAGTGGASAQFKAVQVGRGNIAASYTWETTQAMDWRVGPSDQYYNGIPNQSVFIHGFKIAVREGILGSKWVNVKADIPSVRPYRVEFSSGSWLSNLFSGVFGSSSGSMSSTLKGTDTSLNTDNNLPVDQSNNVREDITIHRFPQVIKPFHPSDFINQHLLREVPSATVAVTHDSQWTTLLKRGLLNPDELSQEDRLIAGVTSNCSIILTHEGAVYLENRAIEDDVDDDAIRASMFSELEGHLDLSPMPPASDTPATQLSDSALPAADDPSARPYACAYGSILFTNPESSHSMYRTAHELQEHVTVAHADIMGTHIPVFRCGLAGCGQSWKRIEELDYHIRFSGAHSWNTNPEGPAGLFLKSSESRQVFPTTALARYADLGVSVLGEPPADQIRDISSHLNFSLLDRTIFRDSDLGVPLMERSERYSNRYLLTTQCNFCKGRNLRCDRARPACGGCQRRSLPCIYVESKGKKGIKQISTLSELELEARRLPLAPTPVDFPLSLGYVPSVREFSSSASREGLPLEEHGRTPVSCRRCRAQNIQCHARPGSACVRCTQLSLRCEVQDLKVEHVSALRTKGKPSSGSSKVGLFPPRDALDGVTFQRMGLPTLGRKMPPVSCNPCKAQNLRCDGSDPSCANCARRSIWCDLATKGKNKNVSQPTLLLDR